MENSLVVLHLKSETERLKTTTVIFKSETERLKTTTVISKSDKTHVIQ